MTRPLRHRRTRLRALVLIPIIALGAYGQTSSAGQAPTEPAVSDDVVLDWNEIAVDTIGNQPPFVAARSMAVVQVAVFEAVNAITGTYDPYLGTIGAPADASPEAAAVAAAHGALVALFPGQAGVLDQQRDGSLAAIADGQSKDDGIEVGVAAAAAIVTNRTGDGSTPPAFFVPTSTDPYEWQTTAGCPPAGGVFFHWQNLAPFAVESSSQFRAEAPPALGTGAYARDFDEVKAVGDVNADSTLRPPALADAARFYAAVPPHYAWNSALRQIAGARTDDITDTARTAAVMNMAIVDAHVSVFESKYHYRTWRPVTAIPRADEDGNDKTDAGSFTPYIATPCFPGYPSAHGSAAGAAEITLQRAYGRFGHSIVSTHPNVPGVEFVYSDLRDITANIADARVYGGIHFRYDQVAGERQGKAVGQYVHNHLLERRGG